MLTPPTARKASIAGYTEPLPLLDPNITEYSFQGSGSSDFQVEVFFPGPGHMEDNITVWIPGDSVLFGGCLVKAIENTNLGNTADAVIGQWASSVQALQARYPKMNTVAPGHGRIGDASLLQHTIDLANAGNRARRRPRGVLFSAEEDKEAENRYPGSR